MTNPGYVKFFPLFSRNFLAYLVIFMKAVVIMVQISRSSIFMFELLIASRNSGEIPVLLRISLESKDIAGLSNSDSGGSSGAASFLTTWFFSARNFRG